MVIFNIVFLVIFPNRISITTLRNPVERCISHYNWIMEKNLIDKDISLEECFKKNLITPNIITQIFSGANNKDLNINNNKFDICIKKNYKKY